MLSNPRAERVRAVRRLAGPSARSRSGRFVVEGPQAFREAVRSRPPLVLEAYATDEAATRHPDLVAAAAGSGVVVRRVTPEVLAAMADTVTPQGLLAVCSLVDVRLEQALVAHPRLVAVLANVRDPGNAGTVLRAADAAGAEAVVLTRESVDVHNPKCVRASVGSIFHLPVVTGVDLVEACDALRRAGLTVLAADGAGGHDLDDLLDEAAAAVTDTASTAGQRPWLTGPVAWVFGNEARGLAPREVAVADAVVRVPVHGRAESLNLATAATVCLYASARAQRRTVGCRAAN